MINIEDKHIREAESLLIDGDKFEEKERIPFIKQLNSCDLLAVPGSGKTTALLAKLYCLSKQLPFADGSGILVLSHTNAAVNEIEDKLKKVVPNLFEYPNFVGTVQSFINKFLALPYYNMKYDSNVRVDDVTYYQEIENILQFQRKGTIAYFKNKNKAIFFNARYWFDEEGNTIISDGVSNEKLKLNIPKKWKKEGTAEHKERKIYDFIFKTKKSLIEKGILHYDDCYYIANKHIDKHSLIKKILQKRYKYVFIDEMQDLEKYQIDIIDKIFHTTESPTIIQRIGDINQSIYNSRKSVKTKADWQVREPIMYLNDSYRLTKEVSEVVNFFTLDRQQDENGNPRFVVNGKRVLNSGIIQPHLILFDDDSKDKLKNTFIELIKKFKLEKTKEGKKYGFKIIGWNAKWDDEQNHNGKLRLENMFDEYKKDKASLKETYDLLSKYLQYFDKDKKTLASARKSILNAFIHILRIEGKMYSITIRGKEQNRYFTKKELIKHIQENENHYENFKSKLFQWSFDLVIFHKYKDVYEDIKNFVNSDYKNWLGFYVSEKTNEFIGENFEELIQEQVKPKEKKADDINIEIGTVHSVKGQTHCATMYVETSFHKYETEKKNIIEALKKEEHNFNLVDDKDKYGKQSFKMMYVGFSRPTHLLCFAVLKDNIKGEMDNFNNTGWQIIDLTDKIEND